MTNLLRRTLSVCSLLVFLLAPGAAWAQTVVHVDASASGANDGTSWSDAYVHLQDAVDEANTNAGTEYEIRIAEGVYYPDEDDVDQVSQIPEPATGDHAEDDPSEAFILARDDVALLGGYPAGGGERDPQAHPTVLSGDVTQDDATDADGVTETADDQNGDNSFHVVSIGENILEIPGSGGSLTSATRLDGLIVTAGEANGSSTTDMNGGGINNNESTPAIVDVVLAGNLAESTGGGMYNPGDPTLVNVTFTGNHAGVQGTGIPGAGGGLYNNGDFGASNPTLVNVVFTGNSSNGSGGALYNSGVNQGESSPTITGATFAGNTATGQFGCGGAVVNDATVDGSSEPEMTNAVLWGNSATGGGDQICNRDTGTTLTISQSILEGGIGGIQEDFGSSTTDGGDVLAQDPQFADADGADDVVGTLDDDVRLQGPGSAGGPSPAIDAGDDGALPADVHDVDGDGDTAETLPLDRAGLDRTFDVGGVSGSGVDMGAYESDGSPLPVELARFEAQADEDAVHLTWRTASETNNSGFAVERTNGRTDAWTKIVFVEGAGTTTEAQTYRFTDEEVPFGAERVRYRLRQVDYDGTFEYSEPVEVALGAPERFVLRPSYPNPYTEQTSDRYELPKATRVRLAVYDALGRRVATLVNDEQEAGRHEATFAPRDLPSGVYFLRFASEGATRTQKLTIVR